MMDHPVVLRIRKAAERAAKAQDALIAAIEKAKERKDWQKICEKYGLNPEANHSDWMC